MGMAGSQFKYLFHCPAGFFSSAVVYREEFGSKQDEYVKKAIFEHGQGLEGEKRSPYSAREEEKQSGRTIGDHSIGIAEREIGIKQQWACNGCGAIFQTLEEQRLHFKSDYHRWNVKRRLAGKDSITEGEFETIAQGQRQREDDMSSISGSDDESEDEEEKIKKAGASKLHRTSTIPLFFPATGERFLVWRSVVVGEREHLLGEKGFTGEAQAVDGLYVKDDEILSRLNSLVGAFADTNNLRRKTPHHWVVLLAAGGHFAGIVVNFRGGEVVAHQTHHRYVVRAKAGGRQSTRDATGKAPKSAGASLRRYNELALQKEIRDTMSNWAEFLNLASHIFVHAPSTNSQALFAGENAPLDRSDPRIRRIPLTTKRPTFKEAKRIFHLLAALTSVEDNGRPLDELTNEAGCEKIEGDMAHVKIGVNSPEHKLGQESEPHDKLNTVLMKGQDALGVKFFTPELGVTDPNEHLVPTALHEAAKSGNNESVLKLLEDGNDPCARDRRGCTPYALAIDKETRNVFRRFMARNPDLWDWQAANVPSPLTEEMETAQAAKQAEKDAKWKEREKERKKLKKLKEKAERAHQAEKKATELAAAAQANVRYAGSDSKKLLASISSSSSQTNKALAKAQTQEREIRAAAAESRMRSLLAIQNNESSSPGTASTTKITASSSCSCCGASLVGKTCFHRFSFQYCSTTCVQVHKKYLESE